MAHAAPTNISSDPRYSDCLCLGRARAPAGLMQKQLVKGSTVHVLRSVRQYTLVSYSIYMHTEA